VLSDRFGRRSALNVVVMFPAPVFLFVFSALSMSLLYTTGCALYIAKRKFFYDCWVGVWGRQAGDGGLLGLLGWRGCRVLRAAHGLTRSFGLGGRMLLPAGSAGLPGGLCTLFLGAVRSCGGAAFLAAPLIQDAVSLAQLRLCHSPCHATILPHRLRTRAT